MDELRQLQDEWLALRCQAGEAAAFRELVTAMERPLLYYAARLTGRMDVAADVVQETWIKAARTISRLEKPGSLRAWLYRIAHGLAVDRVRHELARRRAEDQAVDVTASDEEEMGFSAEQAEAVHRALDQIPVLQREVLALFFLEEFSIAEISAIVGCSEGTVKSRLHYGKAALRAVLRPCSITL